MKIALFLCVSLSAFPQSLDTGKRIFESQCALCHGQDGSGGRGPMLGAWSYHLFPIGCPMNPPGTNGFSILALAQGPWLST